MAQIRFQVEQHYPAGLDQLWATLGQREYVQSKYRSLGSARLRILKLEVDETVIHVTLERRVPAAGEAIPVWARVLAVGHHTLRHDTRWSRVGTKRIDAEFDIWAVGTPARAKASGAVVEVAPDRTKMTLDFTVRCDVPAIGLKAARLFTDQVKRALDRDHRFTVDYLTGKSAPAPRVACSQRRA